MFPVVSFGIAFSLLIGINKKAQEVDFVAPGWRRGGPRLDVEMCKIAPFEISTSTVSTPMYFQLTK